MSLSTIVGVTLIIFTVLAHLKFKIKEFDISTVAGELAAIVFLICFVLLTHKYFDYGIQSIREFWKVVGMLFILKFYNWWMLWKKK